MKYSPGRLCAGLAVLGLGIAQAQEGGFVAPSLPGYQARALWTQARGWVLAFDQFDTPTGPRRIFATQSADGKKWSPPSRLSPSLPSLTAPALAEGPGDKVYLFGVSSADMKAWTPQVWTSADGRAWSEAAVLPLRTDGAPVLSISVATGPKNEMFAAYQYTDPLNQNKATIAFARSADGVKWSDTARIALADRRRPNLLIAPDGTFYLAYQGLAGNAFEVFSRRSSDFKTWTPEVQATHDGNSHDASLAFGKPGELILTYVSVRQGKNSFDLQRTVSKDKGATWTWDRALCDTTEMEYAPAVAAGPGANRYLLFSRGSPASGTSLQSMPF